MAITYDPTTADPGQIEKIPATDVIIDPNVRTRVRLDKSFISSIRVYGFQQHPVGYRTEDQKVHITVGQRRISAALEIGWPVIAVVVKPRIAAEADRTEELRILEQLAENEQRDDLTDAERVAGYKKLALLGVSDDQIARKTNQPKQKVLTALAVATSDAAETVITTRNLTLDEAAVFVEFEGDTDALEQLTEQADTDPAQLEHTAQRIRDERADQEVITRLEQEIRDLGATPIHTWEEWNNCREATAMWRTDDPHRTRITIDDLTNYTDVVGWIRPGNRSDTNRGYRITWGIRTHKTQGLTTYNDGPAKGPLTDEEKARRATKRQARKDMLAATTVRRAWLRDTLLHTSRKKLPTDAIKWIALAAARAPGNLRETGSSSDLDLALELLDHPYDSSTYERLDGHGPYVHGNKIALIELTKTAPLRVALAVAIAQTEAVVGNPKGDAFGQDERAKPYLQQLQAWGYTLADVETALTGATE